MGNHTVNKKEISEGAAGINDRVTTTAVAWQNNKPQKLEIEVTNDQEVKNLPFMIENGDIVASTGEEVIVKSKQNTIEDVKAWKAQSNRGESR